MNLWRDILYAARSLRKTPGFTLAAVLTLALGIGATTGMFTLLDQVALRKLPVAAPDELVSMRWEGSWYGSNNGFSAWSYPWYEDLRDENEVFSDVLARDLMSVSFGYGGEAERINAELITGNYFELLGLSASAGRLIEESDSRVEDPAQVVVLTHAFWRNRLEGRLDVIGEEIEIGGRAFTVIGVAPEDFYGVVLGETPQVFVPMGLKPALAAGWEQQYDLVSRRSRWMHVMARLKPGVSIEQAQAAMTTLHAALVEFDLNQPEMAQAGNYTREQYRKAQLVVEPGSQGISMVRNQASVPLWILTAMVGLLLLTGCANVANLMMARAEARQKEVAVRLALGSGRGRIIRQLMVESVLLAALGGIPAVLVASLTVEGLVRVIDEPSMAAVLSTDPDWRMLAFAAAVSMLTAVLFGLTPAWQSVSVRVATTLKAQAGAIAGGHVGLRKALVTVQVFLSLVLLIGAGLMWRTLASLKDVDSGYETEHVVVFAMEPPRNGLNLEQTRALLQELRRRIAGLPGVDDAAYSLVRVLGDNTWNSGVDVVGYEEQPGENTTVWENAVSPGYFSTLGVAVLEGRDFRDGDENVVIVNQAFARYFFDGGPALGRQVRRRDQGAEIVGVVADARYDNLREEIPRQIFSPYDAVDYTLEAHLFTRTQGDPAALISTLRAVTAEVAQGHPIYDMKTMESQAETTLVLERLLATLGGAFGGLAALLSGVGLYGVMAFSMARRTREIGLRIALGAQRGNIAWLAMREAVALFVIGAVLALPASFFLARYVESQLFGVSPYDPWTLSAATGLLAGVAGLAALLPALRAARTEPMQALRFE